MALLEISDLYAFYGQAQALSGISLEVEEGSIGAVVGPNGAGKSTLFDSLLGLVDCRGEVRFRKQDMQSLSCRHRVEKGLGYAPERGNLFPFMSVKDNLLVGATTAREQAETGLESVYELFPILSERRAQEVGTLSGGEQQMVSLGRALMTCPSLLLVDEPTIGLAPKVCDDIMEALKKLNEEQGLTILLSEQNVHYATLLADQVYVMESGVICSSGPVEEMLANPAINEAYFGSAVESVPRA